MSLFKGKTDVATFWATFGCKIGLLFIPTSGLTVPSTYLIGLHVIQLEGRCVNDDDDNDNDVCHN